MNDTDREGARAAKPGPVNEPGSSAAAINRMRRR